jgi:hypothetical protein
MARTIDPSQNVIALPTLADAVINGEIQLPHFQRPYVWPKQRRAGLFRSILEGFPMGSVLLWQTAGKRGYTNPLNLGRDDMRTRTSRFLVVDGQQRLTSLAQQFFLSQKDRSDWGRFDGRVVSALVVDLDERDGSKVFSWRSPESVARVDVAIFEKSKVLLAELLSDKYQSKVLQNLSGRSAPRWIRRGQEIRQQLHDAQILAEFLPSRCDVSMAVQAFERINTAGSRLGVIDVAAARLFESFPDLSEELVDFHRTISQDAQRRPAFGAITRESLLMSMLFKVYGTANPAGARRDVAPQPPEEKVVESKWIEVKRQYTRLREFLEGFMRFRNSDSLETLYLVTASEVLARARDSASQSRLAEWLLRALVWLPYTGGATKSKLDADLLIVREDAPDLWQKLRANIDANATVHPGTSEFTPALLVGRRDRKLSKRSIVHHCIWLTAHHNGAVDWSSGAPLPAQAGPDSILRWDRHHIFPKAVLDASIRKKLEWRMGNLAWLTRDTNRNLIRKTSPSVYMPRVLRTEHGDVALRAQGVPTSDPSLYDDASRFIEARERELCRQLNELLSWLGEGKSLRYEKPGLQLQASAADILTAASFREGPHLEFKQTFRVEIESWSETDVLSDACVKVVASFANMGGGTLIVGVDRDGNVVGIDREEAELRKSDQRKKKQDPDAAIAFRELDLELQKYVRSRTYPTGSKSVAHPDCMSVRVETVQGKRVIIVRVRQAREEIWVRRSDKPQEQRWVLYQRQGAACEPIRTVPGDKKMPAQFASPSPSSEQPSTTTP